MTFPGAPPDRVLVEYAPVLYVGFDIKAGAGPAPPSFVQSEGVNSSSAASLTVAFDSNVTSGHVLLAAVVGASLDGVSNTASVTDTQGNTYTQVGTYVTASPNGTISLFGTVASNTGPDTVTLTSTPGAVNFIRLLIQEFAGVSVVDQHNSANGAAYPLSSGNMTTAAATGVVFGWGVSDNGVTTPGTGFTIARTQALESTEYQIFTGAGTYAAIFPGDNGTSVWGCIGAILK